MKPITESNVPTELMAILSTGHLQTEEREHLKAAILRNDINGMTRKEGFLVHTTYQPNDSFSNLNYTLGYLRAHGFHWALFDIDGDQIPDLNFYKYG